MSKPQRSISSWWSIQYKTLSMKYKTLSLIKRNVTRMSQSYLILNGSGRKYYIRRDNNCSTPYFVYIAYCKKCKKQGVVSTILWKPRLPNYKSHIKKNVCSCKIATHVIDECCHKETPFKYLAFVIIDTVSNISGLTCNQIEELLLKKQKFWFGTLVR